MKQRGRQMQIKLEKAQKYLEWLKTKLLLDRISKNAARRIVKRGEVYECHLGIGVGSEESKKRPCVIIQNDIANINSSNVIVAPITHTKSNLPVVVPISDKHDKDGKVILDGHVLAGNIVCVSKSRLGDYITKLDRNEMKRVDEALQDAIGIKRYIIKLNKQLNDKDVYINKLKERIDNLEGKLKQYSN